LACYTEMTQFLGQSSDAVLPTLGAVLSGGVKSIEIDARITEAIANTSGEVVEAGDDVDWSAYMDDAEEPTTSPELPTNGSQSEPNGHSHSSWDMANDAIIDEVDTGDFIEINSRNPSGSGGDSPSVSPTCFLNSSFRQKITSELLEAQAFLTAKIQVETGMAAQILSIPQTMGASDTLQQKLTAENAQKWLGIVKAIQSSMQDETFLRLLRIVDSEVFLDKLCSELKRRSLLSTKYRRQIKESQDAQKSAVTARNAIHPRLKEISAECRSRKLYLEQAISKKYDNRPVNIMGQFNFI